MEHETVILIGAARSGTNMLRDVLTRLPHFGTWPCDEINYIWRHGNSRHPTDELKAAQATPRVRQFIRSAFRRLAGRKRLAWVVEKTCANSLRVEFVDRILPEAKYIFLVRDGRDVVVSAMRRWTAPLDIPYILRKARFVPLSDLPFYALRYLGSRAYRLASPEKRLAVWGPRFEGLDALCHRYCLAQICAGQWVRCVRLAETGLRSVDPARVHVVSYERFVADPLACLKALLTFLGQNATGTRLQKAVDHVRSHRSGAWRYTMDRATYDSTMPLLHSTLKRWGYEPATDVIPDGNSSWPTDGKADPRMTGIERRIELQKRPVFDR